MKQVDLARNRVNNYYWSQGHSSQLLENCHQQVPRLLPLAGQPLVVSANITSLPREYGRFGNSSSQMYYAKFCDQAEQYNAQVLGTTECPYGIMITTTDRQVIGMVKLIGEPTLLGLANVNDPDGNKTVCFGGLYMIDRILKHKTDQLKQDEPNFPGWRTIQADDLTIMRGRFISPDYLALISPETTTRFSSMMISARNRAQQQL